MDAQNFRFREVVLIGLLCLFVGALVSLIVDRLDWLPIVRHETVVEPPTAPPGNAEARPIALPARSSPRTASAGALPSMPAQASSAIPASDSAHAVSLAEPAPPEMPQQVVLLNAGNVVAVATGSSVGGGTLLGKVILRGSPPNPDTAIRTGADPKCRHSGEFKTENWKVADDGSLADVVVWLETPGVNGVPLTVEPVMNQVGCRYEPHVMAITRGTTVAIENSDSTLHNVHGLEWHGRRFRPAELFNFPQIGVRTDERRLDKASFVRLECNVHPWMLGWIVVLDTPWFAVSGADGEFSITGVPSGEFILKAWHSQFDQPLSQDVRITGDSTVEIQFDAALAGK
jgi:plastocyanin